MGGSLTINVFIYFFAVIVVGMLWNFFLLHDKFNLSSEVFFNDHLYGGGGGGNYGGDQFK